MTREHERFEALAGAVALGEATPAERASFEAHVATCEGCRTSARDTPAVVAAIGAARDAETWRPPLDNVVSGRIREARARRSSFAVSTLGWAVAASLVLNVAFASGFAARLATAFHETGESRSGVIATRLELEKRARPFAVSLEPRLAAVAITRAGSPFASDSRRAARKRVVAAGRRAAPVKAAHPVARSGAVEPDVLAGLDVDRPLHRARTVALEPACDHGVPPLAEAPCPPDPFSERR